MLAGLGAAMATLILLAGAAGVFLLLQVLDIEQIGNLGVDDAEPDQPRNYLVVGSDERPEGDEVAGQRSDTLMIVRIEPDRSQVQVLSIPRDLVVPISGRSEEARINSAYGYGRAVLLDTIRDNLGIQIHHYVEVDFGAFEHVVDAAGGVPIWASTPIKDEPTGLLIPEPGCTVLDGQQALAYVRSRNLQYVTTSGEWSVPDPTADLGRIQRQQIFLHQVMATAIDRGTANPSRIPRLVATVADSLAVDDKLSVPDLITLANRLRGMGPDAMQTHTLPVVPSDGGGTVELDESAVDDVLARFRGSSAEAGERAEPGTASSSPDSERSRPQSAGTSGAGTAEDGGAGSPRSQPPDGGPPTGESGFQVGDPPPGVDC